MYTIGKVIQQRSKTNKFRIVIEYEHGDADAYTEETCWLDLSIGEKRVDEQLQLFKHFTSGEYNDFICYHMSRGPADRAKRAAKLVELSGVDVNTCDRWLQDHEVSNASYNDAVARATGMTVVFFDENGLIREVLLDNANP